MSNLRAVYEYANFAHAFGAGLVPDFPNYDGFTAKGDITTTQNIITPLSGITLANLSYNIPTVAQQFWLVSTSTQDNPTGTGAATCFVFGLASDYSTLSELVTLNGQTGVQTVNSYIRIYSMVILTFGSGNTLTNGRRFSAGDIYVSLTNSGGAGSPPTDPVIGIDGTNADVLLRSVANRESLYTVPLGKKLIIEEFTVGSETSKTCRIDVEIGVFGEDFHRDISPKYVDVGVNRFVLKPSLTIEEKSDIRIVAKTDTGTSYIDCNFVGALYEGA